jgi:hypothetical protein
MIRGSGEEGWAMAQKAVDERSAYEQAIRAEKSGTRMGLIIFTASASLWLLLQTDWLPENVVDILEGPKDQISRGTIWLALALIGTGIAILSYLDLRALRLGTVRAQKLAYVAKLVARVVTVLFCVAFVGLFIVLLGIIISDWIAGIREQFPFFAVNYFVHILIIFVMFFAITWIERRTRTAELIIALIVLGALLAGDIAAGGFMIWDGLQLARERELPVWIAFVNAIPNLLVALFLILGILTTVRRRALVASHQEASELSR